MSTTTRGSHEINKPTADALATTREYWVEQRNELVRQVAEIEKFLGFTDQQADLAVRVAKIESFIGLNKG